jgi:hypothetical protein
MPDNVNILIGAIGYWTFKTPRGLFDNGICELTVPLLMSDSVKYQKESLSSKLDVGLVLLNNLEDILPGINLTAEQKQLISDFIELNK